MIKPAKKIQSVRAIAAIKSTTEFWTSIDGEKLSRVGLKEKESDLVGPVRAEKQVKFA
ncbi:hypothetical protein Q3V30_14535 [Erwinia pyri]|uniref:Uncharacterized protein n=1 Tax=Erwinia pyri TaxID=3062598 RepID=A0AA50DGA8_9GAMM|nr:hypothetical protein [Erwinia sp. DE2]WLS77689.1 hypothetical protein Q3V30_14535 [Erwinia sp. DE2]